MPNSPPIRLLQATEPAAPGSCITVEGRSWALESHEDGTPLPEFACISYAWGKERVPHPFVLGALISNRALAALETAARQVKGTALWLDAFCVPTEPAERAATLRSLGSIYAKASKVLVVLSAEALPLFQEHQREQAPSGDTLRRLEKEDWVRRFWTYQELARSKELEFLVNGAEGSGPLSGMDFLNSVGEALYRASAEQLSLLPALESLVDVLASWVHTGSKPFAYQVMAGMVQREAEQPADRFNSVLGALDPEGACEGSADLATAAEQFMATCESNGDFSFIYSTGPRSELPGRSWRPVASELSPLLAWHTFGNGQRGGSFRTHALLHDLSVVRRGSPGERAREFLEAWAARTTGGRGAKDLPSAVAHALTTMGCKIGASAIELETGYFFPAMASRVDPMSVVLVATEVRWVHGAPGLLALPLPSGRYRCLDVGVFVGPVTPGVGASIEIE